MVQQGEFWLCSQCWPLSVTQPPVSRSRFFHFPFLILMPLHPFGRHYGRGLFYTLYIYPSFPFLADCRPLLRFIVLTYRVATPRKTSVNRYRGEREDGCRHCECVPSNKRRMHEQNVVHVLKKGSEKLDDAAARVSALRLSTFIVSILSSSFQIERLRDSRDVTQIFKRCLRLYDSTALQP